MKKENYLDLGDFLVARNPLAFKDEKNTIMYFQTYKEAYEEMLERLYKAGPVYVDLVLFAMDTYGMEKKDAEQFVRKFWSIGLKEQELLLNWQSEAPSERARLREQLAKVAKGLHMLVESKFQSDMFLAAFDAFMVKLNYQKK